MREIKFRRWRKFNDRVGFIMEYFNLNMREDNLECDLSFGEVMQYTGVRDKNGKEIYEGDIVKYFTNENAEITFRNGAFMVESNTDIDCMCSLYGEIEVIGNIYENEDLLEK